MAWTSTRFWTGSVPFWTKNCRNWWESDHFPAEKGMEVAKKVMEVVGNGVVVAKKGVVATKKRPIGGHFHALLDGYETIFAIFGDVFRSNFALDWAWEPLIVEPHLLITELHHFMKPLLWDSVDENGQPYRYDVNPNVTWDGILEPGDPGYVAPPATVNKQTKLKSMKHESYYPTTQAEQILWLENFRLKLANHAAVLGVPTLLCAARVADARWLIYMLGSWLPAERAWHKSVTEAINRAQRSGNATLMVLPVFVPPPLPAAVGGDPAVVPVDEGALDRIFAIVQTMKESPAFNGSIAADMGTIGTAESGPDYGTLTPVLKLSIVNGRVLVGWGWNGFGAWLDALQIEVDRGAGWVPLAVDTTPDYIDTTPQPAALTRWKYRAIYNVDGAQVGLWSTVAEIVVG